MKISKLFQAQLIREIILFGVLAILMSFFFSVAIRSRLLDEFTNRGSAISESIASSSVELLLNRDASTIQATIDQFVDAESGVAYVFVSDHQDQLVAHSFVPRVPEEISGITQGETDRTVVRDITIANQGNFLDIASPILAGTVGYAHVGMDQGVIEGVIRSVILTQIGLIAVIFAISMIIAYIQANRVSQPLLQLAQFARNVSSGNSSAQIALQASQQLQPIAERSDEVGQLTLDFQRMVAEIYKREEKLQQQQVELAQANQEITKLSKRLKIENIRLEAELGVSRQESVTEPTEPPLPEVTESSSTIWQRTEAPISTVEVTELSEIDVTRQLQQLLLPGANEVQQIQGLEMAGSLNNQLAFDYYDQLMEDRRIQIGIANLNNSLSNSCLMLMSGKVLRTLLTSDEKEQRLFLNRLKRTIQRCNKSHSLALLDLRKDGEVKEGGQGQQIMVVDHDGKVTLVDGQDLALPVGVNPEVVGEARLHFQPIRGILLFSTGSPLTQTTGASSGVEQVQAIVSRHWQKPADAIVAALLEELPKTSETGQLSSDFSLLLLKQK
jgi:serine phosphatase RsbU (regulator of sigma subunit)